MSDSNTRDALEAKQERNHQQRVTSIKRWIEYIKTHDVDEWGEQQNRLVNTQLESARQSDLDVEHRRRVAQAGRDHSRSSNRCQGSFRQCCTQGAGIAASESVSTAEERNGSSDIQYCQERRPEYGEPIQGDPRVYYQKYGSVVTAGCGQ